MLLEASQKSKKITVARRKFGEVWQMKRWTVILEWRLSVIIRLVFFSLSLFLLMEATKKILKSLREPTSADQVQLLVNIGRLLSIRISKIGKQWKVIKSLAEEKLLFQSIFCFVFLFVSAWNLGIVTLSPLSSLILFLGIGNSMCLLPKKLFILRVGTKITNRFNYIRW